MDQKKPIFLKDWMKGSNGVKLNYTRLRKAVMQCEADENHQKCKEALKELGIDLE